MQIMILIIQTLINIVINTCSTASNMLQYDIRSPRSVAASSRALTSPAAPGRSGPGSQGFQGYGLPILRIRYLVPRMFVCICV